MSEKEKKCNCGCDEHAKDCDCGCDYEDEPIPLVTEDGKKYLVYLVGTIEYEGKTYSAFEPAEQIDGIDDDELIIFEVAGDDEEKADLLPVEDDALLDAVFQEFCKALDEEELLEEVEEIEK